MVAAARAIPETTTIESGGSRWDPVFSTEPAPGSMCPAPRVDTPTSFPTVRAQGHSVECEVWDCKRTTTRTLLLGETEPVDQIDNWNGKSDVAEQQHHLAMSLADGQRDAMTVVNALYPLSYLASAFLQ